MKPNLRELTEEWERQLILDEKAAIKVSWRESRSRNSGRKDYTFNFTLYGKDAIEAIQETGESPIQGARRLLEYALGEDSVTLKSLKGNSATFIIDYTTTPIE